MGIFDDAIREHLELKRHAGADEEELKELEDEAFGQAARPGEPDFPSTSEEAALEPNGAEAGAAAPEAPPSEAAPAGGMFDAETTVLGSQAPDDAVIDAPSEEEPALTPLDEAGTPATDETVGRPEESASPAEPATDEGPSALDEPATAEGPVALPDDAPPADSGEASSFTTAEREAIADQPTVFFEQQPPAELELGDLELDLDEEIEEVGGSVSEPLPGEEPLPEEEPLAVEQAFSEPEGDTQVAEPPHEIEPEPALPAEEPESLAEPEPSPEGVEPATGDEDVLEETPEFLRDNPDDDELWFEQGEPKDFDF